MLPKNMEVPREEFQTLLQEQQFNREFLLDISNLLKINLAKIKDRGPVIDQWQELRTIIRDRVRDSVQDKK